ncbi:MAG: mechanosensitive ion channel family protein [Planctomycetota bacterium]
MPGPFLDTWNTEALALGALLAVFLLVLLVTRYLILPLVRIGIKKSKFEWDDAFVDAKCFRWLSYIAAVAVFLAATNVMDLLHTMGLVSTDVALTNVPWLPYLQNLAKAVIALSIMMAIVAVLNAVNDIYTKRKGAGRRPIKGYVQIAKIFVYVVGIVSTIALLFGKAPWLFISGFGAFTAILLLVFKDTILSLVASIQLTTNDMIRIGDWVEVPSAGADGDVIDIALHTVKIQNWDKTVTTVPTHSLIAGSFKNWRTMPESGGRRIKRSIYIDISTIHFLDDKDIERFSKFALLQDYMAQKTQELEAYNKEHATDPSIVVNARRLTNIGTFRHYVVEYLKQHPRVHKGMTFLIRQLQPTPKGLPLEVYIFSNITGWVDYEGIQSDIFDHLLAALPEFDLMAFQEPAGSNITELAIAASGGAAGEATAKGTSGQSA